MEPTLIKKIDWAVNFLQSIPQGDPIEVAYSGGKDSDVILELARMSGIKHRAIYKSTTIDPPGTLAHVRDMGVEILRPRYTFAQVIARKGIPSRYMRFCCSVLKEYKVLDRAILGIRRDESTARSSRYREPELCRRYSAKEVVRHYYPILNWSLSDVVGFLRDRNIRCAPCYYDELGQFHPERRLGCMCCPMGSRAHRISEFLRFPGMVKLYCRAGDKWLDAHPGARRNPVQSDVYRLFVRTLFFERNEDFNSATHGLFGDVDCKRFLEGYFNIKF